MATTPEQMQQQWMAEMMRRQQMEQQWAAQQGAYSGQPGAPAMPAQQQPQQYAQPDIWRPQQPVPLPVGNEQMNYAGGTPGFYAQPARQPQQPQMPVIAQPDVWRPATQPQAPPQQWAVQPQQPGAQPDVWQPQKPQMPVGGAATQQPQMPVFAQPDVWQRPAVQPNPEMLRRQQMEQQWMKQQGAYSGQAGAPVPMPVMGGGQRGLRNAYSRGARGAGMINQLNAREQQPQDAYAGQGLTDEQRKVAQANEASIRAQQPQPAQQPGQQPVDMLGRVNAQQPTPKWAEDRYVPPAGGTQPPTGDEDMSQSAWMGMPKMKQQPSMPKMPMV